MVSIRSVGQALVSRLTSSEQTPLGPIHGHQKLRSQTHALREVCTSPSVDRPKPASGAPSFAEIEHSTVTDIGKASEMPVLERLVHSSIQIAVPNVVGIQAIAQASQLVELVCEILALLMSTLCSSRQGGELVINLPEKLSKLPKIKSS